MILKLSDVSKQLRNIEEMPSKMQGRSCEENNKNNKKKYIEAHTPLRFVKP